MKIEYQIIKKRNNCFNTNEQFEYLLQSTESFELDEKKKTIKFEDLEIKYNMKQCDITEDTNEVIFNIEFDIEKDKDIEKFEKFDDKFLNIVRSYSNDEMNVIFINTLMDEISKYYGQQMYLLINEIETKFRKMIYLFMVKNLGTKWMEISVPENLRKKDEIKKKKNKEDINNREEEKEENKNDYLIETDFSYLIDFLFKKYSNVDSKKMINEIDGKETLSKEQIKDLMEKYKEKSNWERYFSKYSNEEDKIKDNLKKLYGDRNKVAHNKRIRKAEYDETNKLVDYLNKIFDKCLENISKITVPDKEKEYLENIGNSMINSAYMANENIFGPTNTAYTTLISPMNLGIDNIPKLDFYGGYDDLMLTPNRNISIVNDYINPLENQIIAPGLLNINIDNKQ